MPRESRLVILSPAQRNELKRVVDNPDSSDKEKCRALIVLLLGEGLSNKDIAKRLNVHENTVIKWRSRWTGEEEIPSILDKPTESSGRPRDVLTISKLDEIKKVSGSRPKDADRWTVRSLAKAVDLPIATTQRALVELDIDLMLQSSTYE